MTATLTPFNSSRTHHDRVDAGFSTRRIAGRIGAQIDGLDLADLSDANADALWSALLEHRVVFLRDQRLDDEGQVQLARRFGPLTAAHPTLTELHTAPEVFDLDSTKGARANNWHTDVTFVDRPPSASVLRAVVLPPYGGDTVWANTVAAYDGLPEALKDQIDDLDVVHSNAFDYVAAAREGVRQDDESVRDYGKAFSSTTFRTQHPLVAVHPETGERSLLAGGFARSIVGYEPEASARLLRTLHNHVTRLENTVRWTWSAGDVALWDNRSTQHYAIADYGDLPRRMQRVTLAGTIPVGVDGRRSSVIDGDSSAYTPAA